MARVDRLGSRPPAPARKTARGSKAAGRDDPRLLQRYRRLVEISRDLISTLELPALLKRIVEAARELTDTEAASILLIEPRSGELRFETSTQPDARLLYEGLLVPREGSIAGWIVQHGRPLLIPDVTRDPRHYAQVDQRINFVTRSVLGVPLAARDEIIGVLEAINKVGDDGFAPDDTDTLVTLAAQAAVAIETARLFHQNDLVSEMIHELRTPLGSLAATSHMLLRPDLPDERRREFVHTIQRETARLTHLTNDFLDFSRLESGRARFRREPFAMPDLLAECLAIVQPQAQERGLTCTLHLAPEAETGPALVGDRAKIKQVLLNLLTNAIKYNRHGGTIALRGTRREREFETTVSDTGQGIPPESLPHIFDKFYRVADVEGQTPGTGLGLAIAKRIVETHGGTISVESAVGSGTTFRFALPLPA